MLLFTTWKKWNWTTADTLLSLTGFLLPSPLPHSSSPRFFLTFPKKCEKAFHSAWSTCHFFCFKRTQSFPISFDITTWFVQKGPPKVTVLQFTHSQLSASFNATQIISLLYLALVINLFIALCLPSLSAQWPLFRAHASCTKDIQALQSQLCSLANGRASLSFLCCLEAQP